MTYGPTDGAPAAVGFHRRKSAPTTGRVPILHREARFVFRFYSSDRGEPPHVHVVGNDGRAKVWLAPVEVVRVRRYDGRQRSLIEHIAREHRHEWLKAWNDFFGR